MGHCTQCGGKVKPGQEFCTSCGTPVQSEEPEPSAKTRADIKSSSFFQTRKFRILAIITIILFSGLFTGYKIIESANHPAKIVQQFEDAVDSKNTKELAKLLNAGQDKMNVTEKDAETLLSYYKDNPDILADTIDALRNEATTLKNNVLTTSKDKKNQILSLVERKKKWLLFTQYGISFKPVYFVLSVNEPTVSVTINGIKQEDIEDGDKKTFGPFLPVEHEIIGAYKGTYGTASVKEKIDPLDYDNNKISVKLDLTQDYAYLQSNYDDAIVFVNGKSTGKTIEELENFGPVSTDGKIKLHAEVTDQGQKLKSEEVTITEAAQSVSLYIDDSPIYEAQAREAEQEAELELAEEAIQNVIYDHYSYITYGNHSSAYDLFSSSRKDKIDFEKWSKGLSNTLSDTVNGISVDSIDGNNATATIEMTSRDAQEDGSILVQKWGGKWELVKEFSGWKLHDSKISKLDSWVE